MTDQVDRTVEWVYEGLWGVLVRWLRVPRKAPDLPVAAGDSILMLRPAREWLRYLKAQFVLTHLFVGMVDLALLVGLIAAFIAAPPVGALLVIPYVAFVALPPAIAYLALHVRYDSTWYVLTNRSMRIRRGIWVIHETTITYENIQNVTVNQGPLERFFGIANVVVKTAGGGGMEGHPGHASMSSHVGLLEGLTNANEIRELIQSRARQSAAAGLGDEPEHDTPPRPNREPSSWPVGTEHLATLRQIRDTLREMTVA